MSIQMPFAAAVPAPLRRQAARWAAAADRKSRANRPSDGCHGPCFSVRNTRLRRPFGHVFLLQHAEAFCNSESHFPGGFEIPRREKLHEERQNGRLPTAVLCISRRPLVKMAQVLAWWLDFSPHCSSDRRTAFVLSRAAPLQRFLE